MVLYSHSQSFLQNTASLGCQFLSSLSSRCFRGLLGSCQGSPQYGRRLERLKWQKALDGDTQCRDSHFWPVHTPGTPGFHENQMPNTVISCFMWARVGYCSFLRCASFSVLLPLWSGFDGCCFQCSWRKESRWALHGHEQPHRRRLNGLFWTCRLAMFGFGLLK